MDHRKIFLNSYRDGLTLSSDFNVLLNFQKAIIVIVTIKLLVFLPDIDNAWSLNAVIFLEIIFYDKLVATMNNLGGTNNTFFLQVMEFKIYAHQQYKFILYINKWLVDLIKKNVWNVTF